MTSKGVHDIVRGIGRSKRVLLRLRRAIPSPGKAPQEANLRGSLDAFSTNLLPASPSEGEKPPKSLLRFQRCRSWQLFVLGSPKRVIPVTCVCFTRRVGAVLGGWRSAAEGIRYEQPSAKPQGNYKSKLLQTNSYYSNLFKYVIILLELEFKKQNKFIAILCNLGVSLYDDYFFLNALILKVEHVGHLKCTEEYFFPVLY